AHRGEDTPELSDAAKEVFREVVEGMSHTSHRLGFVHPPEYVRPPPPSADLSASTRAAAKTQLRRDLKGALLGCLHLRADIAECLVSRIFSRPTREEASDTAKAAKEANAQAFAVGFPLSAQEDVKNSGVEGEALTGVVVAETWAVHEFQSLFQRGAGNDLLPFTFFMDSLFIPSMPVDATSEAGGTSGEDGGGDGCSGGVGSGSQAPTPTREEVLDNGAARQRLGAGLYLDRRGATDGLGGKGSGHQLPSSALSASSDAMCRETLQAAVGAG
ncbi:unnamed protein product, partial [Ectocarpus fasciculatus]